MNGERAEGKRGNEEVDRAYLLCVAVSRPTRARHREGHGREEGRGDEDGEGTGGKVTVFASSEKICRLIQQLGALSPPTPSRPHSPPLPPLLSPSFTRILSIAGLFLLSYFNCYQDRKTRVLNY